MTFIFPDMGEPNYGLPRAIMAMSQDTPRAPTINLPEMRPIINLPATVLTPTIAVNVPEPKVNIPPPIITVEAAKVLVEAPKMCILGTMLERPATASLPIVTARTDKSEPIQLIPFTQHLDLITGKSAQKTDSSQYQEYDLVPKLIVRKMIEETVKTRSRRQAGDEPGQPDDDEFVTKSEVKLLIEACKEKIDLPPGESALTPIDAHRLNAICRYYNRNFISRAEVTSKYVKRDELDALVKTQVQAVLEEKIREQALEAAAGEAV